MMGTMRSKEPWSIFQLKFFYQMSPLLPEPCNLTAFSPQEFPNVIYLIPFFFDMGKKEVAESKKKVLKTNKNPRIYSW